MKASCVTLVFFLLHLYVQAQEIPLGTWRMHISYSSVHAIAISNSRMYGASQSGVVAVNRSDNSVTSLNKLSGLSGADITHIANDQARNQLLVGYADGTVDIVKATEVVQFTTLKNSPAIPGSKRINHVWVQQNLAYFSTDYGVVVFDLVQLQVKETWRDLGSAGQSIKINECTVLGDSIFLATANGVIAGDLKTNLLDFANWKRFNSGAFNAPIESVATFAGTVYAAIDGSGLFSYGNGTWTQLGFSSSDFNRLGTGTDLFITEGNNLWRLNSSQLITPIVSEKISSPFHAVSDSNGNIWIADGKNGLISNASGLFAVIKPNGPTFLSGLRTRYENDRVYITPRGFTAGFTPASSTDPINYFSSGNWSAETFLLSQNATAIAFSGSKTLVASFGNGLHVTNATSSVTYTTENSPLGTNNIPALAASTDGVWVCTYGSTVPLHLLKSDNTWQSFSFPTLAAQYPVDLIVDKNKQVWMSLNPAFGGGIVVFNLEKNQSTYLIDANGSGGLPSRSVQSMAVDRDGQVWVGTAAGVAYFTNPAQIFSGSVNAVKPIFNGRFLLRDETVTAIAVDGGNRKWFGTQRGVWLFDAFGEKEIYSFNMQNSPLLSDRIQSMAVHPKTGEVFFHTDKGILSFRSDATGSEPTFATVKIFPNPVTAEFKGQVSISGLATDALVKVTDLSGQLIWQTQANGGTATWNVRDYSGRRAASGMYLVIAVAADATESVVGKIAVVN